MTSRRFRVCFLIVTAVLLSALFLLPEALPKDPLDQQDPPPLAPYPATWLYHMLFVGPEGSSLGITFGTATLDGSGDGSYAGTTIESGATPSPHSGTISMTVDPSNKTVLVDTTTPDPGIVMDNGVLNPDEDVVLSSHSGAEHDTGPFLLVRRGSSYSNSNLEGTWILHTVSIEPAGIGSGHADGVIVLDSGGDGTFDLTFEDNDGHTGAESGDVSAAVDSNGTVTATDTTGGGSDLIFDNGILSSDKGLIVYSSLEDDSPEIGFLVKRGTDYEPGDLAGNWVFHALFFTSDLIGSGASSGTLTVDTSGVGVINAVEVEGAGWNEMFSGSVQVSVDVNGIVTLTETVEPPPDQIFDNGILSADRNLLVAAYLVDDEIELLVATRDGKGFNQADLAGDWEINTLLAGTSAPWWVRGQVTAASSGSFSGTLTQYNGSSLPVSGDMEIAADGCLTSDELGPDWQGAADLGNTVIAGTNSSGAPDTGQVYAMVKRASFYVSGDIVGDWNVSLLASGPGAPWWGTGTMTVASGGGVSGTLNRYDGGSDSLSGNMSISMFTGIISWAGRFGDWRGVLDSGKTVMVWTDIWDENYLGAPADGTSEIAVLLKQAGSYSTSDLAGLWLLQSLVSGPAAPAWTRGYIIVEESGLFSGHVIDLDGTARWYAGLLSIDSNGIVTLSGNPSFSGAMDADKTVIAATETLMDLYATSQLDILLKVGYAKWFDTYPTRPIVSVDEYLNFTTTLGLGDYSFHLNDSGGTIDPDTGLYHAGATGDVADVLLTELDAGSAVTVIEVDSGPRDPGRTGPPTSMDVNGGGVNIDDVILMLRHVVGLDTLDELQQLAADFDLDGSVSIGDVITALRVVVGLPPVL